MKKQFFLAPALLCFLLCSLAYANSVQNNLSQELLRLHIIANSDSVADQEIKLKVRDRIIESVGNEFSQVNDKNVYRAMLMKKTDEIKKIADSVLAEYGVDYTSDVTFEKLYIPRKYYDGIVLPEGSYEGMIVRLGKSEGKNWWCVVYPPLCFTESTCGELSNDALEYLKDTLSPESYSLITDEGIDIEYKFKLVEIFQKA